MDERLATKMFFVNGPEDTGNTMLYSYLMSTWRGQNRAVLTVVYTGISVHLIESGMTVHSTCRLSFGTFNDQSTSTIRLQSHRATRIRDAALIL